MIIILIQEGNFSNSKKEGWGTFYLKNGEKHVKKKKIIIIFIIKNKI